MTNQPLNNMISRLDNPLRPDVGRIGSRMSRIDPGIFYNQSGAAMEDGNDEPIQADENRLTDEPVDDEGDPTDMSDHGENDHHQDDNYALGGHVTRSGSI